jgi:sulfate permease, SulP family
VPFPKRPDRPPWRPRRLVPPEVGDAVAGLSVALVLIPQSLAYAVLAGMPPQTGLIVGAVATIAAAPFVSSIWLQTGPVAITSMLTAGALVGMAGTATGEYVMLAALLALLVGVIRLLIGLLQAGALAYLMSQPVLVGFIPGAAIVIAASQLPAALGAAAPTPDAIVRDAVLALADPTGWDVTAIGLTVATLAVMLGARRIHPLVPGVLIAAIGGIVFSQVTGYTGETIGEIPALDLGLRLGLPWARSFDLLLPAAVIALVGFAEAAAISRSFATETRTRWSADREFVSQGAANIAAGLFGGFPAGGSFSRSAINRVAGAKTAWSGAITGVLVLAFLPFADLLETLPSAVLSAIIIGAIMGLMSPKRLLELRNFSHMQFGIALITFALTIALAPQIHIAVVIGVSLAVVAHLRRELMLSVYHWINDEGELHLRPRGVLYFGSAHVLEDQLIDLLHEHPDINRLVLHLDGLGRVDVTGALQTRTLLTEATAAGVDIIVTDLTPPSRKIMHRVLGQNEGIRIEDPEWPLGDDEADESADAD